MAGVFSNISYNPDKLLSFPEPNSLICTMGQQ